MKKPELHIRENLDGVPMKGECTVCPFPEVFFSVSERRTYDADKAELDRQFFEHFKQVHLREDASQAAARIVREATKD